MRHPEGWIMQRNGLMSDAEFPFVVTEDEEIIARFKHLKDAAKFASYHEWGDFHHKT